METEMMTTRVVTREEVRRAMEEAFRAGAAAAMYGTGPRREVTTAMFAKAVAAASSMESAVETVARAEMGMEVSKARNTTPMEFERVSSARFRSAVEAAYRAGVESMV